MLGRFYNKSKETVEQFSIKEGIMVFVFVMIFTVIAGLLTLFISKSAILI